jgi:hypothetical protein
VGSGTRLQTSHLGRRQQIRTTAAAQMRDPEAKQITARLALIYGRAKFAVLREMTERKLRDRRAALIAALAIPQLVLAGRGKSSMRPQDTLGP